MKSVLINFMIRGYMKKYLKEIIILIIQLFMFYIYPIFCGPTDAMAMVIIILFTTLLLSTIISSISKNKIIFLYPVVTSLFFIPSIFIWYNESALIHSLWYFVVSLIGLLLGNIFNLINKKISK